MTGLHSTLIIGSEPIGLTDVSSSAFLFSFFGQAENEKTDTKNPGFPGLLITILLLTYISDSLSPPSVPPVHQSHLG